MDFGDSHNPWKKVLWSDVIKIELCGHQGQRYVWHKPNNCHHAENTITLWGCFSSAETGKLVRTEGKKDAAKYRKILEGNLFEFARVLRLGLGSSPFSKTMTLSTLLKHHSSGLRRNSEMSWSGPVKVQTSIQLRICRMI